MKRRADRDRRQYLCECAECGGPFKDNRRTQLNARGMGGRRRNEEDYPARHGRSLQPKKRPA